MAVYVPQFLSFFSQRLSAFSSCPQLLAPPRGACVQHEYFSIYETPVASYRRRDHHLFKSTVYIFSSRNPNLPPSVFPYHRARTTFYFPCRSIDVKVGSVNLDVPTLFRRRSLRFQHPPPSGNAIVVFNARDFGNFLAHPLIRRTRLAGSWFVFDREGVTIDAGSRTVEFGGRWGAKKLRVALSQASAREPLVARVTQSRVDEKKESGGDNIAEEAAMVASGLSKYFNNLEVDLDGPTLSFSSLDFEGGRSGVMGGREKVKLSLGIVVRKLPSIRAVASF